jgi:hypothetical protein
MQPGIVEEKASFKTFPESESAAVLLRDKAACMIRPDERHAAIAWSEVPFPEPRGRITPVAQLIGDGSRSAWKRIKIIADPILRRRHSSEQCGASKGPKRVRRYGLVKPNSAPRQVIEMRCANICVARDSERLPAPLRGDNPKNVGAART